MMKASLHLDEISPDWLGICARQVASLRRVLIQIPALKHVTIDEVFGGWGKPQRTHFSEGGILDQIQRAVSRH